MNKPNSYHKSHGEIKEYLGYLIKENFPKKQWRPADVGDTYIDIGTGPGDVAMDYIYPLLPLNHRKIVFSDISSAMLEFARNYYGSIEKSDYKILDIAEKTGLPSELQRQFNHATCIMVLHWVPDIRLVCN